MRKIMLAALTAMLLLALGAGSAMASRSINVSPTGANRAAGTLTFSSPEVEFLRIRCLVTLTLANVAGGAKSTATNIANVTGATATGCEGGTIRVLAPSVASPWRTTYVSFTGTLPTIATVTLELRGVGFLAAIFGTNCLFGGNAQGTTVGGTTVTEIRANTSPAVPLVRDLGSFPACPRNGNFSGNLRLERSLRLTLA